MGGGYRLRDASIGEGLRDDCKTKKTKKTKVQNRTGKRLDESPDMAAWGQLFAVTCQTYSRATAPAGSQSTSSSRSRHSCAATSSGAPTGQARSPAQPQSAYSCSGVLNRE